MKGENSVLAQQNANELNLIKEMKCGDIDDTSLTVSYGDQDKKEGLR